MNYDPEIGCVAVAFGLRSVALLASAGDASLILISAMSIGPGSPASLNLNSRLAPDAPFKEPIPDPSFTPGFGSAAYSFPEANRVAGLNP